MYFSIFLSIFFNWNIILFISRDIWQKYVFSFIQVNICSDFFLLALVLLSNSSISLREFMSIPSILNVVLTKTHEIKPPQILYAVNFVLDTGKILPQISNNSYFARQQILVTEPGVGCGLSRDDHNNSWFNHYIMTLLAVSYFSPPATEDKRNWIRHKTFNFNPPEQSEWGSKRKRPKSWQ